MNDNSKIKFKKLCEDKTGETKLTEEEKKSFDKDDKKEEPKSDKTKKVEELKKQAEQVKTKVEEEIKDEKKPEKEEEEKDGPEKNKQKSVMQLMEVSPTGEVIAKTLEEKIVMARAYMKSGMLPACFDTEAKIITGLQFVSELGLKSLTALRQVYIVNGTPNIFGDLPLALVRRSGKMSFFEEFLFDSKFEKICFENKNINGQVFGAVCRVRREQEGVVEKIFTVDDALTAGVFFKDKDGHLIPNGKKDCWGKYPKIMLMYRARAAALKVAFSDILNGVGILEYDSDMIGEIPEADRDHEKEMILEHIQRLLSKCRKIPEFNAAKENDMINMHIENQDMRFASRESLEKLVKYIDEYLKLNLPPA